MIECLGTSFTMSPEVYEEHLVNSGWRNGTYNDQEPETWITRDMKKSHMSIRWYRPVKRVVQRPSSTLDRQRLLNSWTEGFSWTEAVPNDLGKPHGVKHVSRPTTNILRRDWDTKTDAEANTTVGDFAAWEERATVWSKQFGPKFGGYRVGQTHVTKAMAVEWLTNGNVVVLLLDPLLIVKDEMTGAAEALKRLGADGTDGTEPTAKRQGAKKISMEPFVTEVSATDRTSRGLVKSSTFVRSRPKADQNFSILSLGRLIFGKPTVGPRQKDREYLKP